MKRLLIKLLILALLALVYFSACKKPEDCWRCQHVNTATGAMYYRTYCDMTQDDIVILERSLAKEHIMSACSPLK